jgi:hypothetical protein
MNLHPSTDERLAAGEQLIEAYEARIRFLRHALRREHMQMTISADLRRSQAMDELRSIFYGEAEMDVRELTLV